MASKNLILKSILKKVIPEKYRRLLLRIYYFGYRFNCPICNGHFCKFLPSGVKPRPNACCPGCRCLERHRLLWLYLKDKTNFFTDYLKVLHIAPMQILQEKCKKLENLDYISADISSPLTMITMDITYISLRDNQFDCIICYHVLEHIPDDEKAMRELFRILKPGGWAILQSPVDPNRDKTFEDSNVISAEERERIFGQKDHVRIYGRDYKDRLERAGFTVKYDNYVRELGDDTIKKYGLSKDEIIYFCHKRALFPLTYFARAKEKDNPTVSVIIPTYNRAHLIDRSIKSVLDQTYQDFEIIVVDDGSTDNTEETVKSFDNKRIRYIRHEKNKGAAAARNTGIKTARGEYIAFQDSDDEWLPNKLEKQMKIFETAPPEIGVVYTGFWRIKDDRKTYIPSSKVKQKEGDIHSILLKENFVTTQASVVKKECFRKVSIFDERLPRLQDWELWIRISKYYLFKCIDEPLVISHHQPDSISANRDAFIKAFKLILEKHFEEFKEDKKLLANQYSGIGHILCSWGNFKQGGNYLIKAAKTYPLNINLLLAALASFFDPGKVDRWIDLRLITQMTWSRPKKALFTFMRLIPHFSILVKFFLLLIFFLLPLHLAKKAIKHLITKNKSDSNDIGCMHL